MCVRTGTYPESKQKVEDPANPKRKKKCQMTSQLPPSFNLVVIGHFLEHCEHKKRRTLEPFKDFPAFLVDLQVADKGGRIPAALFCGIFSCRAWVYGVQLKF